MRVGIISIYYESNMLISVPTTLDGFRQFGLPTGETDIGAGRLFRGTAVAVGTLRDEHMARTATRTVIPASRQTSSGTLAVVVNVLGYVVFWHGGPVDWVLLPLLDIPEGKCCPIGLLPGLNPSPAQNGLP